MLTTARIFLMTLFLVFLSLSSEAQQKAIVIKDLHSRIIDNHIKVNCDVSYRLEDSVKEALSNGIEMSFRLEIELMQQNPYWLDNTQARIEREFIVKYHALSKQFVMKDAGSDIERSFPDLYSAFYYQRRLHNAILAQEDKLESEQHLYLRARARLLSEQLPLPLRIKSYLSSDWRPSSGWTIWPM